MPPKAKPAETEPDKSGEEIKFPKEWKAGEPELEAPAEEEALLDTRFGKVTMAELEELLMAEAREEFRAKADEEQAIKDATLPQICDICFPEGWDSANALDHEGVGCEHGTWSRKARKE